MTVLEEEQMIENVELTLGILRHFADENDYPTKLTINSLYEQFSDKEEKEIVYSVYCATETGLLDGTVSFAEPLSGPQTCCVGSLRGLSPAGGEYVRAAENHFGAAMERIRQAGEQVTTSALLQVTKTLVTKSLGFD
ncbi:MAG: hypothetical protein OXD01_11505 [Gammaproteobacteria bacterium]|nr:hypothetical protein [Gammaproteobacteria bacterium]